MLVLGTAVPALAIDYPGEPLEVGSRGEAVRLWQEALGVPADGIFGEGTRAATIRWQTERGLAADGVVGPTSWKVMFPDFIINPDNVRLSINGSGHGHGVGLTQYGAKGMAQDGYTATQILQHYYQGSSVAHINEAIPGSYVVLDPLSLWVGLRQNRSELAFTVTTGRVKLCFDQDYDSYPILVEGKSLEQENTFTDLLLTRLAELGYLQEASTDFGETTHQAVISLQADQGLEADGAVGSQTWEALLQASGLPDCAGAYYLANGEQLVVKANGDGSCSTNLVGAAAGCRLSLQELSPDDRVSVSGLNYSGQVQQFAHGNLRIRPNGGEMHLVLQVGINDYVAGIAEIPNGWPDAALQAQAIAARSYAVYAMLRRGSESALSSARRSACWCHVVNNTRDQVYAGWNKEVSGEGRWAEVGAQATAGMVMTHPEEELMVVQAFYSSASGGATEDSSALWGTAGRPYLVSVQDPWSIHPVVNPNAFWSRTVSLSGLLDIYGLEDRFGDIISVSTVSYPWGSAQFLNIAGIQGGARTTERVSASILKSALRLRSRFFTVEYLADWWAPPPAPTGLTVTGGRVATVSWNSVPSRFAPERYTISVDPAHSDPITVSASQTSQVVSGLQPGVAYSFTVTAGNQIGSSEPSAPTSPAAVIVEYPYPGEPLREGSQGSDVRVWQEALGQVADGAFGPATVAATKEWQERNGLTPDGVVGESSWNKMFVPPAPSETDPETPETDPETPETDPETPETDPETPETDPETPETDPETPETDPETPETDPETPETDRTDTTESQVPDYPGFVLRVGSRGKWVRTWQAALGVSADGHFGAQTAQATREWQQANGLAADGVVGVQSWQTMFPGAGVEQPKPPPDQSGDTGDDSSDTLNTGTGSITGVPPFPGKPLQIGDQGSNVIIWQRALGIAADGYYGTSTLSATKAWQYRQGLTPDGVVGVSSWLRMFPGAEAEEGTSTPDGSADTGSGLTAEVPSYPGKPLQIGDQGADVVIWQRALGVAADGQFGSHTARATRTWQQANGLEVDGVVGVSSWLRMFPGADVSAGGDVSTGSSSSSGGMPSSRVVLKRGSTGLNVERWQEALGIEVTGFFDENTVAYTKYWQRTHSIAADGRVTEASWSRMFPGEEAPTGDDSSSDNSSSTSTDQSPSSERPPLEVLERESKGWRVELWQEALGIEVTGVFDENTVAYTKYWQRTQGIAADGRVTEASWYRVFPWEKAPTGDDSSSTGDDSSSDDSSSTSTDQSPSSERPLLEVLERGSEGWRVELWQEALGIEVTGVFDDNTVAYTKFWQRTQGIAAHGRVTEAFWYRMFPDDD